MKLLFRAILLSVLVSFLSTLMTFGLEMTSSSILDFSLMIMMSLVSAFIALIVVVFWAVPMHFVLLKYKYTNVTWYLALALIPAVVFIFGFKPFGEDKLEDLLFQLLLVSFIACNTALTFWHVLKPDLKNDKNVLL